VQRPVLETTSGPQKAECTERFMNKGARVALAKNNSPRKPNERASRTSHSKAPGPLRAIKGEPAGGDPSRPHQKNANKSVRLAAREVSGEGRKKHGEDHYKNECQAARGTDVSLDTKTIEGENRAKAELKSLNEGEAYREPGTVGASKALGSRERSRESVVECRSRDRTP